VPTPLALLTAATRRTLPTAIIIIIVIIIIHIVCFQIVHGALCAKHVLLDEQMHAKITGFERTANNRTSLKSTLPPPLQVAAPPALALPPPLQVAAPPALAQPPPFQFGVTGVNTTTELAIARRSRFSEPSHGFTVPHLPLPTPSLDIVQQAMGEISENIFDGLMSYDEASLAHELPNELMMSPMMYPPSSPSSSVASVMSVASPSQAASPSRDVMITTQVSALLQTTTAHITAPLDRNTQAMDAFARILEEHSAIFKNLQKERERKREGERREGRWEPDVDCIVYIFNRFVLQ
jgi:hypothetical protein